MNDGLKKAYYTIVPLFFTPSSTTIVKEATLTLPPLVEELGLKYSNTIGEKALAKSLH